MNILLLAFSLLCVFITSVVFHELGHYLYFKMGLNQEIDIRFYYKSIMDFGFLAGNIEDYKGITDNQYIGLNITGIILGFTPIILSGIFFANLYYLMALPYIWGAKEDLFEVLNHFKLEE